MKTRPNVLCIITDDTDFSMLGYSGGKVLTPNIDRIAAEGVACSRFYTASPVCQPSRYNYLTGRYSGGCPTEVFDDSGPRRDEPYCLLWNTDLYPERERTFADGLRAAGYRTGYVGKWHAGPSKQELGIDQFQGDEDPADPAVRERLLEDQSKMQEQVRRCGFDYAAAVTWANADNRKIRRLHVHNLEWICKGALDFLDKQAGRDEPFFLYVCTSTIHGPSHILGILDDERLTGVGYEDDHVGCMPPRQSILWRLEDTAGVGINHRSVGALWTDDLVGVLTGKLESMGIADETAVIFSTDHNCFDGKASCYEGGVHIPFAMKAPGLIPPGHTSDALVSNVDFAETLLDLCGAEAPEGMGSDGRSVLPCLTSRTSELDGREELFVEFGYQRAVLTKKWKYIATRYPQRLLEEMKSGERDIAPNVQGKWSADLVMRRYPETYWDADKLFDLQSDPDEKTNLAGDPDHAEVLSDMKRRLQKYLDGLVRPFDLEQVDPYVTTEEFRAKAAATEALSSVEQSEWYQKGWY